MRAFIMPVDVLVYGMIDAERVRKQQSWNNEYSSSIVGIFFLTNEEDVEHEAESKEMLENQMILCCRLSILSA